MRVTHHAILAAGIAKALHPLQDLRNHDSNLATCQLIADTDMSTIAKGHVADAGVTFAGDHGGNIFALRTSDGTVMWKRQVQGSIAGGIITYKVLAKQYVAVVAGKATLSPRVGAGPPSVFIYGLPN